MPPLLGVVIITPTPSSSKVVASLCKSEHHYCQNNQGNNRETGILPEPFHRTLLAQVYHSGGPFLFAGPSLSHIGMNRFSRHSPDDIKSVEIVPPFHRLENCIPSAAIRWPDFGDWSSFGRPFCHFVRHLDTPLLSFPHGHRFPRPTPERVFVVDHRSGSGFSGTVPSAPPPRPIGT